MPKCTKSSPGIGINCKAIKKRGKSGAEYGNNRKETIGFSVFLHRDARGKAGEKKADGGADSAHIDKPAEGFSTENRTGKRNTDAKQERVFRSSVFGVDDGKGFGKVPVSGHRIHQARGGHVKAHNAR